MERAGLMRDLEEFSAVLDGQGLHAALRLLNGRTPHRFTAVYRYDGAVLRNIALVDRWNPAVTQGEDAPLTQTFCAIIPTQGKALEVQDGHADERFPWMAANKVVSYCGALIRDHLGEPFGTLCHFDLGRCEAPSTQLPLLAAVTPLIFRALPK